MTTPTNARRAWRLAALAAGVLVLGLLATSLGTNEAVGASAVLRVLAHGLGLPIGTVTPVEISTVLEVRLPHVALALLAGSTLALAGAALQGLFRNPLADPSLIGVSGGGAVGAVAVIVLGGAMGAGGWAEWFGAFALPLAAMAGGLAVTLLLYQLAKIEGRTHLTLMLLAGLALNALAGAVVGLMVYVATDEQMRALVFWSLGSLNKAGWRQISAAACFALPAMAAALTLARPLNAFALGEAEAFHLGVPVQTVKRRLIFLSAAMVGAVVAVCGTIGFLGLVAPHLARLLFGPDHRWLLPASALLGAALLLAADLAARTLTGGFDELPVGVVTALAGAPVFLALLLRARRTGTF